MATHVRCPACRVMIPRVDLEDSAEPYCTLCGAAIKLPPVSSAEVAAAESNPKPKAKKTKKRWVVVDGPAGTYFHNTENGTDTWERPADIDAEIEATPPLVQIPDSARAAIMNEQNRRDARRRGLPESLCADEPTLASMRNGRAVAARSSGGTRPGGVGATNAVRQERVEQTALDQRRTPAARSLGRTATRDPIDLHESNPPTLLSESSSEDEADDEGRGSLCVVA